MCKYDDIKVPTCTHPPAISSSSGDGNLLSSLSAVVIQAHFTTTPSRVVPHSQSKISATTAEHSPSNHYHHHHQQQQQQRLWLVPTVSAPTTTAAAEQIIAVTVAAATHQQHQRSPATTNNPTPPSAASSSPSPLVFAGGGDPALCTSALAVQQQRQQQQLLQHYQAVAATSSPSSATAFNNCSNSISQQQQQEHIFLDVSATQQQQQQLPNSTFWAESMEKMCGGGQQQQQEMGGAAEFGHQQFAGGEQQQQQLLQQQHQQQFGELMNLPCSSSVSGNVGGAIFQTPSGSTICQLGTAPPPQQQQQMDPYLCSPASSASGSQPRLVHLSGASGGANDSGISSGAGSYGGGPAQPLGGLAHHRQHHHYSNFSPDVHGTEQLDELEPLPRDRCNTWPLRRDGAGNSQTSPLIHDRIPEEESFSTYDDDEMPMDDGIVVGDATDGCCVAAAAMTADSGSTVNQHHHQQLLMMHQQHHNDMCGMVVGRGGTAQQQQQMMSGGGGMAVASSIRRARRPSSSSSTTTTNTTTNANGAGGGGGIATSATATTMTAASSSMGGGGGQQQHYFVGDSGGGEPESPGSGGMDILFHDDFLDEMSPHRPDSAIGDSCSRSDSPPSAAKKATTRRNAWGNMSYADLITQAILNSPEKRLTLSQVYEWMVQNVPYFRDKGDSNSSAGWKNSIRHNLSLHNRFMRIQNEGAGKSSWWVINPDAKPGRNPRRRANTMEAATKAVIDKKRRGARKRVETLVQQKGSNGGCSASMASILGAQSAAMFPSGNDELNEQPQQQQQQQHMVLNAAAPTGGPNFDTFRPRAESTLSVVGGPASCSRLSPPNESSMEFPLWMDQLQQQQQQQQNGADTAAAVPSCSAVVLPTTTTTTTGAGAAAPQPPSVMNPQVSELLDRTDQMRLEATTTAVEQCSSNGRMMSSCNGGLLKMEMGCSTAPSSTASCSSTTSSVLLMPKCEIGAGGDPSLSLVKQEHSPTSSIGNNNCSLSGAMQTPPPSYQELNAVRRPAQLQTNPLLRQLGAGGMRNAGGGTPSPPQMKMGPNTSSMLTAVPSCSSSSSPNNNMFSTSASVVQQQSSSSAPFGTPFQQSSMASAGWLPPGAAVGCGGLPQQQQTMPMMMLHQQQQNGIMVNGNGTVVGIGHLQQQQQYHQFIAANPGMVGATSLPQDLENVNAMPFDQSLLDLNDYEIAPDGQFDFP
ncbi:hypothetical protein niasHT_029589 [Heterodera trifolii]|uniref:Forkhead box protein O n=1 Tax=Heterodera trifolii TaxID=157864 RepID=A0ABD2JB29_9BILA